VAPLPPERVALSDALGRSLAEDLVAARALPPFGDAQMDGYALRASDAPGPGASLPVAFEVFAGDAPGRTLPPGACARVFTGAPLPSGADCVEMQEQVARRGRHVRFRRPAERGRFVRAAGSDLAAGSIALRRGAAVDPGTIGLAAALGEPELPVHRRPRVGVLATGDEIAPLGRAQRPGAIPDSNTHALAAAVADAGAVPIVLPLARDDRASLRRALATARGLDALVTTGGVSVGARDLVRPALREAGARLDFWRVAMRPGKPFAFGRLGRLLVFCLPGNPASSLVTFELFARPALRALQGLEGAGRASVAARLARAEEKPPDLAVYLRGLLRERGGGLWFERLPEQRSGSVPSMAGLGALALLPAGVARLRRGAVVRALVLRPPSAGARVPAVAPRRRRVGAPPRRRAAAALSRAPRPRPSAGPKT